MFSIVLLVAELPGAPRSPIAKSLCFLDFDVNGFWRENDIIILTVKNNSASTSATTGN